MAIGKYFPVGLAWAATLGLAAACLEAQPSSVVPANPAVFTQVIRPYPLPGACCDGQGGCRLTTQAACAGTYLGNGTSCGSPDCNGNGANDACDIASGLSLDLNADGVPDECQVDCIPPCDAWQTDNEDAANPTTFHDFSQAPIPANFFAPGSAPYSGIVYLTGVPLDSTRFSTADTLVKRSADPFGPNDPVGGTQSVNIQIQALHLTGTQPITVTINGVDTRWDVDVRLSSQPQAVSFLTATKTHANGGTYDALLQVLPRFTFTRTDNPSVFKVFDLGEQGQFGLYFLSLQSPWVHRVDASLNVYTDLSQSFIAGVGQGDDGLALVVPIIEEDKDTITEHKIRIPPACSCSADLGDGVVTPGSSVDVTATITNTSNHTCTFSWTVSKVSGTPTVNPMPASGSVTLGPGASTSFTVRMMVPANTLARDHATMRLSVGGDGMCMDDGRICVIPTDETTASNGWDNGGVHRWRQTLLPTTADFQTRVVTERDPGGGGPDTCWFPGSAYSPFTAITGGTWTVTAGNRWGDDFVGWFGAAVTYYRMQGRAPCGTSFPQRMVINCPQGEHTYTNNTLSASFTNTTVTSGRDGQTATRTWP